MDRRKKYRAFILPGMAVILMILNYSRLSGTENIRAIHIVTLIVLGMAAGVLLRNIILYFKGRL